MACTSERRNGERLATKLRLALEPASFMRASDQSHSILILARVAEGIARLQSGLRHDPDSSCPESVSRAPIQVGKTIYTIQIVTERRGRKARVVPDAAR